MTIYGIGAMWNGTEDVTDIFLRNNAAYIGWDEKDAPVVHRLFHRINHGDIVFIKAFPPTMGLLCKAVGVTTEPVGNNIIPDNEYGLKIGVAWLWRAEPDTPLHFGKINDKADFMRRGTLYEELNPVVARRIVDLIVNRA